MSKLRSNWFALFGGVTLLALSMSSAFAGKPDGTPQGQVVSEFVHSLQSEDESESPEESADESEAETTDETELEDTEFANHGECVKAVAQDKEAVGGDNENHGGAVSEAARVTCQDEAAADEDATEGSDEDTEVESESEAESEDAGNGKNHDNGGEDDSSDD